VHAARRDGLLFSLHANPRTTTLPCSIKISFWAIGFSSLVFLSLAAYSSGQDSTGKGDKGDLLTGRRLVASPAFFPRLAEIGALLLRAAYTQVQ